MEAGGRPQTRKKHARVYAPSMKKRKREGSSSAVRKAEGAAEGKARGVYKKAGVLIEERNDPVNTKAVAPFGSSKEKRKHMIAGNHEKKG